MSSLLLRKKALLRAGDGGAPPAPTLVPSWSIVSMAPVASTGRYRQMIGSDNANRSTLGPNAAHYGIFGDGGGFDGTSSLGRAAWGFARWHGHLTRGATMTGWSSASGTGVVKNVAGGLNPEAAAPAHGKSWSPIYLWTATPPEPIYALVHEQPSYGTVGTPKSFDEQFQNLYLYKSGNHGLTWARAGDVFWDLQVAGIDFAWLAPSVANAGQCHRAAPDNYIYFMARDVPTQTGSVANPRDFWAGDEMSLVRAPANSGIEVRNNWEFLVSVDGSNVPTWNSNITNRGPVPGLSGAGKAHWTSGLEYIPCIDRYVLLRRDNLRDPINNSTSQTNMGVYNSPTPWGPWELRQTLTNFDPDTSIGADRATWSHGLPQGEILQPYFDGSNWKLPVILTYTGSGDYDCFGATTAEFTLQLNEGATGLLSTGYARYRATANALTHDISIRIGTGSGTDRMLLVLIGTGSETPTAVLDPSGANVTLTVVDTQISATNTRVVAYVALDPTLPAAGTYTLRLTFPTISQVAFAEVWSLRGATQSVPTTIVKNQGTTVSQVQLASLTATKQGAMAFSCATTSSTAGMYCNTPGWLLTYADHDLGAIVSGDSFGCAMRREKAASPTAQAVLWQSRNMTQATALSPARFAAIALVVEPAA